MDIKNKKVLILGGWGLVGSAVARRIIEEKPKKITLTSLKKEDAEEICKELSKEYNKPRGFFEPWWGNIFVRDEFKDMLREIYLNDPSMRLKVVDDIVSELSDRTLKESSLYKLIKKTKPHIIIDCINTSTAIAYQDIYRSYNEILDQLNNPNNHNYDALKISVEKMMCVSYIPQLIRHIQILNNSMEKFKTEFYFKVGTSGTGGMGLNIPYTHSEEKPSRVLLSKSSLAGAQTLLMFLMARTPGGPIVKEIKPTGSIAWKKIGYGEIKKHGKPIDIFETNTNDTQQLNGKFERNIKKKFKTAGKLKTVYIDTGENGIFSKAEYETISTAGQMQFVTPEEIAENLVREIKGGNTGTDIINALDSAVMEPTYRAGFLRNLAIEKLRDLEIKYNTDSVAFEMLGPPRLSKLLYEAYLIRLIYKNFNNYIACNSKKVSEKIFDFIKKNSKLRNEIVSIGIPVLLPNGKEIIRGPEVKIPAPIEGKAIDINETKINKWANNGWVDLRESNWIKWNKRLTGIIRQSASMTNDSKSSRFIFDDDYWDNFEEINIAKVVSWIFINEDKGLRYKG
ncbi:MAG: short-chain dehydrogenase [Bacteroidota bacterium]|nr:short-chain dehydrogenase [Bacteroidota bacterium]